MYRKIIFFTTVIFILTILPAFGKESLLISREQMQSIDGKDRAVSLLRILDNGNLVLLSEATGGKKLRVLVVDPFTKKKLKSIEMPLARLRYAACDPAGEGTLIYGEEDDFWFINLKTGAYKLLFKVEKGKAGFSLFGAGRSRISSYGKKYVSWGYFLDSKGRITKNYVVLIDPAKKGIEIFEKLVSYDSLIKAGKHYLPDTRYLTNILINNNYITFAALNKDKTGGVIAYNTKDNIHFMLDTFKVFNDSTLAREGHLFAFVSMKDVKDKKSELYLYNLKKKEKVILAKGKLMNPVFNQTGTSIIVNEVSLNKNKLTQNLIFIPLNKTEKKIFELNSLFLMCQFIKKDQFAVMLNAKGLSIVKIK